MESVPTRPSRPEVLEFVDCAVPLSDELDDSFRRAEDRSGRTTNLEQFDFYGDVGQQKSTGTESIPTIGNASPKVTNCEEYRCDGPADDPFLDQWSSISPTREVKFLDKAMWLVGAGDYDRDGQSELMFSIDDYNRSGYRYDHFKKEAVFEFSYH